jgi:hydrogenase expression/formation protein HypC
MQVVSIKGAEGKVRSGGIETTVSLDLTPDAAEGDFVIVHAGFAIQRLEREDALETLEILSRLGESWNATD